MTRTNDDVDGGFEAHGAVAVGAAFSVDNTNGYTLVQLAELNRRYLAALADLDPSNQTNKSCQDYVASQVLTNFDNELLAQRLTRAIPTAQVTQMEAKMTKNVQCECGHATGVACEWTGPIKETIVIEYMPESLRASHRAAGNWGTYPHNGALRLRVERSCAERIAAAE